KIIKQFGDDRAETILRAATSPASSTNFPAADIIGAFRSLAPGSAAFALFDAPGALKLDLAGISTVKFPNLAGVPPLGVFVGEGMPAPATQYTLSGTVLGPVKKLLIASATTGELEAATPQTATAVIGRVLSDVANKSLDAVAFGTAAADAVNP